MRYSLRWLGRYVDVTGVDPKVFVNRVTLSVAEVEGFERVGEGLETVRVARILNAQRHPQADRLQVCEVDDGERVRTVVCGAPNARAGLTTALALPGTRVRGKLIEVAPLRGVVSEGMLCSPVELDLSDESNGICELPAEWAPGTPLDAMLPLTDVVFEVDNKSLTHRPDLWGYVGMAREIAAWLGRPLRLPEHDIEEGTEAPPMIDVQDPAACPRYCALGLDIPAIAPSPLWMQALLRRSGVRAISNVVDLTNFVMLEWGNPLHAFDARELHGDTITVRRATAGERVQTLDGAHRELDTESLLICDGARPVALAGVMGLQNSEIRPDTTRIVLESANFRSDVVRKAATRAKLRTEASARYEKSLDPDLPPQAARRFAWLCLHTIPGARVTTRLADVNAGRPPLPVIDIKVSYINERLGTSQSEADVVGVLEGLGFRVHADGDQLRVYVPGWRATKDIAIPEDLVEEVGRLYGYDNIPPQRPLAPLPEPYRHPGRTFHRRVRAALSLSGGLHELQLYSFSSESLLDRVGHPPDARIGVRNPISSDATHLRTHLSPGVLGAVERNRNEVTTFAAYEIGRVYQPSPGQIATQPYRLSMVTWQRRGGDWATDQADALARLKDTLEGLAQRLGVALSYRRAAEPHAWLHPARTADVLLADGTVVGQAGAVHPATAERLEIGAWCAVAELDLDALQAARPAGSPYQPIARVPAVSVDLSAVVPLAVSHAQTEASIRAAGPATLRAVEFVTDFRGAPIDAGHKSLTYRLLFQSADQTLAMETVQAAVQGIAAALERELGGSIRS